MECLLCLEAEAEDVVSPGTNEVGALRTPGCLGALVDSVSFTHNPQFIEYSPGSG